MVLIATVAISGQVFADIDACIDITKEADRDCSTVGDTINYTITIENCGDIELELSEVFDSLGPLDGLCPPILSPGEACQFEVPYVVQEGDPDPLVNEVTVEAVSPDGYIVMDIDTAEVTLLHPELVVDVECLPNGIPVPVGPGHPSAGPGGSRLADV